MKNVFLLIMIFFFAAVPVYGAMTGNISVGTRWHKLYVDDEEPQTTVDYISSFNLSYNKKLTSFSFYQLYIRANYKKTERTDSDDNKVTKDMKTVEPSVQFSLSNPFYQFRTGYQINFRKTSSFTGNKTDTTDELFYSYLTLTPYKMPTVYIQFYKQKVRDKLADVENKDDSKLILSSYYEYRWKGFKGEYYISWQDSTGERPQEVIYRTEGKQFTGNFKLSYTQTFMAGRIRMFGEYKGNFTRNKTIQFSKDTGEILLKRDTTEGLYAKGTLTEPEVEYLDSLMSLVDGDLETPAGDINLSTTLYHNIGVAVTPGERVDHIYIYVNKDTTDDPNLSDIANWKVFKSNINFAGATWTEVSLKTLKVEVYDAVHEIYRYEIEFVEPQDAIYYKVINYSTVFGISDVMVTEIEVYGTEEVSETGRIVNVTKFAQQEVNLGVRVRLHRTLQLNTTLFTKRVDTNMPSLSEPAGKVFNNIFNDPDIEPDREHTIEVNRSYTATLRWTPYSNLSTQFRAQRFEVIDSSGERDYTSNSYSLQINYSPLRRVSSLVTLSKIDAFEFGEHMSTNESIVLTIDTKPFRDVRLNNDIGFRKTRNIAMETETKGRFISGSLDAQLTRKWKTYIGYSINWISDVDSSYTTKRASIMLSYRPGKYFTLSSSFSIRKIQDDTSTSESLSVNWRPVKRLRLNLGMSMSHLEPNTTDTYSVFGTVVWYVRKLLTLRLSYNYNRQKTETEYKIHNIRFQLNCRI